MKKIFILGAACLILLSCSDKKKDEGKKEEKTMMDGEKKQAELLDMKEADETKAAQLAFARGDIDAWAARLDDNVRYTWSGGDSLIGKQAVVDYWKDRWNKVIKSQTLSNMILLPIMVNESQAQGADVPGKWVLYWAMVDATYKNDKNIKFWVHSVNHYNDAGKVDQIGVYVDRHPIMEATADLMK
jgi:hypothetical protein